MTLPPITDRDTGDESDAMSTDDDAERFAAAIAANEAASRWFESGPEKPE